MKRLGSDDDGAGPSSPRLPGDGGWEFDVFLSFRGEDTRNTFTSHLHQALVGKGIRTFIDNEDLEKGKRVEELFEYIKRCRIFVPIISSNYANSKWCLREITKIVECERSVIPVFFDVEASDVQHQTGSFASAFEKHENDKDVSNEVRDWKDALRKVGETSGYTLKETNRNEANLIQRILERIVKELKRTGLHVADHPVGLDSRINDVVGSLEIEYEGIRMIGICGMGGIGKTTLAKAVCNRLSSSFDACSFLANVREESKQPNGVVTLQKQLLRDVLGIETHINNRDEGIASIKTRIGCQKVLIVIDDIDHKDQLEALVANRHTMHHRKSRIIITCRDERVLNAIQHVIIYKLPELDAAQSLQLLSWHAFGKCEPKLGFEELTAKVVSVAGGLPLCLKVFGSQFSDMDTFEEWNSMLEKLKQDQHKEIHQRLKISYDGLDKKTQCIFLDIACFFIGEDKEVAIVMWDDSQLQPLAAIKELMRKSLINLSDETGEFEMHDQIRDMGRQIAREEQSRLWEDDDRTMEVLKGKQERKENIEGIILHPENMFTPLEMIHFENMSKLRLLDVSGAELRGPYHYLPKNLKWLRWRGCPLKSLPNDLDLGKVAVLDVTHSKQLEQVWDGRGSLSRSSSTRTFYHLKVLNLTACWNLRSTPDFRSIPNVVKLIFDGCWELTRVDESIGHLKSLVCLSMRACESLEKIPDSACHLTSLKELDLSYCKMISRLPEHLGNLTNLRTLCLTKCSSLEKIPDSASHLSSLETLDLSYCEIISKLPKHLGDLTNLQTLCLNYCFSLEKIPDSACYLSSLKKLGLYACEKISRLPEHLGDLTNLPTLNLSRCSFLEKIPDSACHLNSLETLDLSNCKKISRLPEHLGDLTNLRTLCLSECSSLKKIPDSACHLSSLEMLELSCCEMISRLPEHLGDLANLRTLYLVWCEQLRCIPQLPPSLIRLDASECSALEIVSDVSNLSVLRTLRLEGCINLMDVSGLENLKCLEELDLRGCRSLSDAMWDRMKEENFQHFQSFLIPRRVSRFDFG